MFRAALSLLFGLLAATPLAAQESSDPVAQALSQGDLYQSRRKYELALDAYQKADKLSHHSSAQSYLKFAFARAARSSASPASSTDFHRSRNVAPNLL